MIVGELYSNDRYGLLLVLSVEPAYKTPAHGQVYCVRVMRVDGTNHITYGEFTQGDWERMHTHVAKTAIKDCHTSSMKCC
jgi:hypothetical protein